MIKLTDSVHVAIRGDRPMMLAFSEWRSANDIYPIYNSAGGSGPDFYNYTHYLVDKPLIEAFFRRYKRELKKAKAAEQSAQVTAPVKPAPPPSVMRKESVERGTPID